MTPPTSIRGLWCATLTPLASDGTIDHARMAAHVRYLFAQGVAGVAPFGTTGEGTSFSVAERTRQITDNMRAMTAPPDPAAMKRMMDESAKAYGKKAQQMPKFPEVVPGGFGPPGRRDHARS